MRSVDSPVSISPPRARALSILHPTHALEPEVFAHYMWPTSPSWHGTTPGRGAYLKARSFLARLEAEGLVSPQREGGGYVVTADGERLAPDVRLEVAAVQPSELVRVG